MTEISRRHLLAGALAFGLQGVLSLPALAQAADPAIRPVENFYDALLDGMRHAQAMKVQGRYDRLEPVMLQSFDVPAMVRFAVGAPFNSLSADDQAALRTTFGKLLVSTFASTFDDFKGERFEVNPEVTTRNKDKLVKSKFIGAGAPVEINYLMRDTGHGWRIIDVYLNGNISQLATWRSQYGSILQSGGPQALLAAVNKQIAKDMAAI
jgi:phospholipid transport system substrate-binding protein